MSKKVCLIDGSGYIFRAYFASPKMTNPEGLPVNAVYGFLNMFLSLTNNIKCDYCLVLFDAKRQNFRNEIFKDYKATRPELPEDLRPQFDLIHEAVEALNIKWLQMEGYEADDLIATYTELALKEGNSVTIVSADKDLMQLIRPNVEFYDSMKNKFFNKEDVKEKFGVYPDKVTDVQALAGDSTDNIPGVPGIGLKTAAELVNQFGSLYEVLENADKIKQNKRRELLITHKEDALISEKLVTLKKDVPVTMPIKDFECLAPNPDILTSLLDRHAFKSLKNKASNWLNNKCNALPKKEEIKATYKEITTLRDLTELKQKIIKENKFSYQVYENNQELIGISIGLTNGNAYYIPINNNIEPFDLFSITTNTTGILKNEITSFLKELFSLNSVLKISINLKENQHILAKSLNLETFPQPIDDISVMSYDLFSSENEHNLDTLSKLILDEELKSSNPELKKIKTPLLASQCVELYANQADYIMRIHQILHQKLIDEKRLYVYDCIDKPLIEVLYNMEKEGIALNALRLKHLDDIFDKELNLLSKEIYSLAGEEFNLSSPKQVGEILYTKLGLKGKKHTSGSLNTSAEVLEKMAQTHELPKKILEWRKYQKLKSTYTTALLNLMDKNNRVHTTYSQISVNTGRLSSLNPNLQNIPIKTDIGKEIRKTFIAKENHKIIAADYSQVELRLLATIANVKFLQQSFQNNVDIHKQTASQVFNIPYSDITPDLRRQAKAINFGIVYGMTAYGLSSEIGISVDKANQYIDSYFREMPEIKTYMEQTINNARINGYTETLLKRKISIFGIKEENKRLASFGERAAINAPIQGTASDIIKLAMIKTYHKLKKHNLKTKMLLQVHDELVFEAPIEEIDIVSNIIKQSMQDVTALNLSVPLIVELGVGNNWEEAH